MAIPMKPKFEEFNDGYAGFYKENDEGELVRAIDYALRFGEENISFSRHYAARTVDKLIDRMIHVPLSPDRLETDWYVLIGEEQDHIEKVDLYKKNLPPILKLTLKRIGKQKRKLIAAGIMKKQGKGESGV